MKHVIWRRGTKETIKKIKINKNTGKRKRKKENPNSCYKLNQTITSQYQNPVFTTPEIQYCNIY
jgi:hypothetical protein